MNQFWQSCVLHLEQEFPPQQISAWIRPLIPLAFDEAQACLRVSAPNRFKLDWVRKNFAHQIETFASDWYKRPVQVLFELHAPDQDQRAPSAETNFQRDTLNAQKETPNASLSARGHDQAQDVTPSTTTHAASPTVQFTGATLAAPATPPADERSRLNVELTFENFVTGKANQLARAAALQVAENPGTSYNPLFLYGGVGLGKTHLIHAIGNALAGLGKGARVRYVHADQYVSDVVKAYQRKAFDDFKRYYHSLDLLLIDDIQFFSGKNRTQEEFFYAFEASRSSSQATRILKSYRVLIRV
jgi:chromosomal replication initiator protein